MSPSRFCIDPLGTAVSGAAAVVAGKAGDSRYQQAHGGVGGVMCEFNRQAVAADRAQVRAAIYKGDERVVIGAEQDNSAYTQNSAASRWLKEALMILR